MTRILPVAALAAAVALGGVALPGAVSAQEASSEASAAETTAETAPEIVEMVKGDVNAPVEIIEYASFTCPHCARFSNEVLPQIEENYIKTGKVKLVYRDVYFDKYGMWAAMVARCSPEKFFGISDMIYKTQGDWVKAGSDQGIADSLRKIGLMAGIGKDQLDACMNDSAKLKALVGWYQENATRDNITSTPSFLIDGKSYSNMSYDDFAKVLDEHYEAAQ
ncbi:thiol-disulfide oxidoreductase [Alloyangia pacifica]|uniref:Thiol-disulfide oxidoreductase n=1 Tax=Alloyangia pacifica TaxID=311180 RepID=A0A2U8HGQ2_9RHOB|nr:MULTISPECIES: DsbA family protein [Roseobacteraceae]AWI85013.1 thiol-disulfide oxidoreductase [Alloyangia pacifica]NDV48637.1 DsbA family protein [Salipiger sp. PrR003]NDW30725.1 DsbA family protein [Salipiger sp. PrR007]